MSPTIGQVDLRGHDLRLPRGNAIRAAEKNPHAAYSVCSRPLARIPPRGSGSGSSAAATLGRHASGAAPHVAKRTWTPSHADRAIACAREIDLYALEIRDRMIGRGIKFGYTRMGLSSGIGLVGNFGGERRFNYTAYGEVVVIAARLEAANKTFGTRILFSGDTLKLARNDIPIEAVGEIDLKGVPVPIPAYTTRNEAAAG